MTDKIIQILCPLCKRGYKPYVFEYCPHCGHPVQEEYKKKMKKHHHKHRDVEVDENGKPLVHKRKSKR